MKPFSKFTYEELIEYNNRDKSSERYINPEPIELELNILQSLIYHYSTLPTTPENTSKLQELIAREDKLAQDLDQAYNT